MAERTCGTYYNDCEPFVVAWLRNLVAAGELPAGDVDERDIRTLTGADLEGYTQVHLFAGIGGWPLALQWAGWPEGREVWTGSCPCQPFSCAGKRKGVADERHLWPAFRRLIAECRPATVFGEQVASRAGREWLAGVRADLEGMGYAVGAADLPAAGVGAPHIRQRLFWVADAQCPRCQRQEHDAERLPCKYRRLGDANGQSRRRKPNASEREAKQGTVAERAGSASAAGGLGDAEGRDGRLPVLARRQEQARAQPERPGAWSDYAIVWCDERAFGRGWVARRIEPDTFPLAHGVPGRVGRIRAYGNAIVPQVAAAFVRAFLDCKGEGR